MKTHQYETIITSQCMCAPATRMSVVHAWIIDGQLEYELLPVVALISRTGMRFSFPRSNGWRCPEISPQAMEEQGWSLEEYTNTIEAVFNDPEYGLVSDEDEILQCVNSKYGRVVFPVPSTDESDTEAIKTVVESLKHDIEFQLEMEEKQKAKSCPPPTPLLAGGKV